MHHIESVSENLRRPPKVDQTLSVQINEVDIQRFKRITDLIISQNILKLSAKLPNLPHICYICSKNYNGLGYLIWHIIAKTVNSPHHTVLLRLHGTHEADHLSRITVLRCNQLLVEKSDGYRIHFSLACLANSNSDKGRWQ